MTLGTQIAWDDTVLPFQLDRSDIRGRVARLDGVLEQVLSKHDYPAQIEALVAESALLTALIGQTIKLRWKLSLQIRGNGAVKLIATDYYGPTDDGQPARIRAYAGYDADTLTDEPAFDQIGEGYFAILIDQGEGTVPYQGITPLSGGSLSKCAETYFAQSEQWRAGGVMLQHMPKASPAISGATGEGGLLTHADILGGDENENWMRANYLLDTVEDLELIGPQLAPTDLLVRLFHEEEPRVYDAQPVRFGCSCSPEKVSDSLAHYPASEIAEMITESGVVTADCQFCGAHYEFDPKTLGSEAHGS